jgi:glucokinase
VTDRPLYLGIEVGGTKLQIVLGDHTAKILERRRFHVNKSEGGAGIRRQTATAIPEILAGRDIAGVGFGFGGPVDWRTGKICCSHQIEGWADFELGRWMYDLTKVAVRIDNDANTAALGEATLGAGRQSNPVFYVTLGSGVGGGLVVDKKIYHGGTPGEAEIGHVRLDKSGRIVEESCSGWAVDKKIRAFVQKEPESQLARLVGSATGGEAKYLAQAVALNDPAAQTILDSTSEDLAFGLSHVTHLCHPEMIILGGGLSLLGEPLRQRVQQHLSHFTMDAFAPGPRVEIAALGEDAVPVGALLLGQFAS